LAEASEREEKHMSVPNIGPEHPDQNEPEDAMRGGNAALVYRDDAPTDEVEAASARASTVTHRFGGVRYALSRPEPSSGGRGDGPGPHAGGSGESDATE
jgi:hypothetical protein